MSAGLSEPAILTNSKSLLLKRSCTQRSAVWRWRSLASPPPAADAYGRRGIGEDLQRQLCGKISRQTLEAKGQACSTSDTCQLGFAAREGDRGLGTGPSLENVTTKENHTTGCRLPSASTPGPVRVAIHINMRRILPWVFKYQPLVLENISA